MVAKADAKALAKADAKPTILFVPGLRGHVAGHWQTLLAAEMPGSHTVPPLEADGLGCAARVAAIERALSAIDGPVVLVAHSAGVLMIAHWAARHASPIAGALLVTPPDLDARWPAQYPQPEVLATQGWSPLPRGPLPFPSIVAASRNDHLASFASAQALAADWGSTLVDLGEVGHLNPASGHGPWPQARELIARLS
ncbi:MAG: alpha/beta hydrolase [Pseudomonadota bacterium]